MTNKIASKRYSTALFDSVKNEELDALLKDAQSLSETMADSQELSSLLKSPLTKNELKSSILLKIIQGLPSEKILSGLVNTLKKIKDLIYLKMFYLIFSMFFLKKGDIKKLK